VPAKDLNTPSSRERFWRVAAVALICGIIACVISLPRNDKELGDRIEQLKHLEELQPGEKLPLIEVPVVSPQPGTVWIPQPDADVLVMFYSGKCPVCRETWPIWNSIAESAADLRNLQALAISVLDEESTRRDLATHSSRTTVGLFAHAAGAAAYKVRHLPVILYIKNQKVVGAWYGVIGQDQKISILQLLAGTRN